MKRITFIATILVLTVSIGAIQQGMGSLAAVANPSDDKSSSEAVSGSTQKLILPEKELREAFEALQIIRLDSPVPMFDFTLENLAGEKIDTKALRGKFLWINFWQIRCPACIWEIPLIQKVWNQFKGENFVILAVNLGDSRNNVFSLVAAFNEQLGLEVNFPILLDKTGHTWNMYGWRFRRSVPGQLFVDPEGNIIGRATGVRYWENEKFHRFLEKLSSQP